MTLLGLAGILAASLFGPLLAVPKFARVPIVVGELAVGIVLGKTGFGLVHASDPVLTFLAQAGFALVMLIAGTHVPVSNKALRAALGRGAILGVGVGILAVPAGAGLSAMAHTHHTALYAVILASSSAAVVMPILHDTGLAGDRVLTLMAQVAIADTACIIAVPLAADPSRAGRAAVGAVIVLAAAGLAFLALRELDERGLIERMRSASIKHTFGLEMRISLAALFALAGLAVTVHVSVMLAGFAFGLALSGVGTPRRLGSQLFAVTEGFLGPVFFVWLGSSVDLRALAHHPRLITLAIGLAVATTVIHALGRLLGQPLPLAILASAQLGVPVAAVALGTRNSLLAPGEGGAILGGAVLTLGIAAACSTVARRSTKPKRVVPRSPAAAGPGPDARPAEPAVTAAASLPPRPREPVALAPNTAAPRVGAGGRAPAPATTYPPSTAAVASSRRATTRPSPPTIAAPTNVTAKPSARAEGAGAAEPAPVRPPTPNPATKPIVQSNVRVQQPPHPVGHNERRHEADDPS